MRKKQFLSFIEAKKLIHKLNIKNRKEWRVYSRSKDKPNNIPSHPEIIYKGLFISWGDWLGTNTIANRKKEFLPYDEAREIIHSKNFSGVNEWKNYCNSGNKPANIPSHPEATYKGLFVSWGDWLGIDTVSSQRKAKENQQKFASLIKSIEESLPYLPMVAWWHILLQNGITPTSSHVKSLKAFQNGKLSVDDLINKKEVYNIPSNPTTQTSPQILRLLDNPLVSNLDKEAIDAIMAEVESQIWEKIFLNEQEEIKLLIIA